MVLALAGIGASAQNQTTSNTQTPAGQSLGEYARQVKKDPGATGKARVFDNDNLPREDKLSVVGKPATADNSAPARVDEPSTAASSAESKVAGNSGSAPTSGDSANKDAANKQWSDKLASQQSEIDLLTRELDVATKEYQLKAAAMYADAGNRLRNAGEWDKQDAQFKQQIADKQKALEDAKQKLNDLEEEARKAGVPSSVREAQPEQQPPQQ